MTVQNENRVPADLLAHLAALLDGNEPLHVLIVRGDRRVELRAGPVLQPPLPETPGNRPLTPCEKDIIVLIEETGKRMTGHAVLRALDAAGKVHGESPVMKALRRLTKGDAPLLTNKTDAYGKGYGLVEW